MFRTNGELMNINDITLFRYIFELDRRDLPNSILRSYEKYGNKITPERREVIEELKKLKGNCRNLVVFQKTFLDTLSKTGANFCQYHKDLLKELDGENGIIKAPHNKDSYVVYSIDRGTLSMWLFNDYKLSNGLSLSIPIYYVCMSPENKEKSKKYKFGYYHMTLVDNAVVDPLYLIHLTIDYLCLRQWAEVEIELGTTTTQKETKKAGKNKKITILGLEYYTFDCKWYTEICNNNLIFVKGYFRRQQCKNGSYKLKWVRKHTRNGYHRKATIDKVKNGEVILN